jgi:hypothetical protein
MDHQICDRDKHCESRDGFMEHARHPQALIGIPPPLRTFVERRRALLQSSSAPCSSPETTGGKTSQVDIAWTGEGTDEFLGHGAATALRSRSPIGVWCRLRASSQEWKRKSETMEERRAHHERTPKDYGGAKGRLCLLTIWGLIGVIRPASDLH